MNILHITPHLGGGVGSVIFAWMRNDRSGFKHSIISLDKNKNDEWKKVDSECAHCDVYDGFWYDSDSLSKIKDLVDQNDVLIIHWWNHPLIYDFICNYKLPPCRIIIWCHAACLKPPYAIPEFIIDYADKLIFTSPVTFESPDIKELPEIKRKKLDVIWSTSGIDNFKDVVKKPHDDFVIGYIGSADFGKLHKSFIRQCSLITGERVRFEIYSIDSQEELSKQAKELGIENRFYFGGRVLRERIPEILSGFDVLGYPLQPNHYGTCEQALGEAMAAGVVPVVINNPPERYIVKNNVNGIVVNSIDDYSKEINSLYTKQDTLKILSENAKKTAVELYDIESTLSKWTQLLNQILSTEKTLHLAIQTKDKVSPEMLYIYSHGKHGDSFKHYINAKNVLELESAKKEIIQLFKSNNMYLSKSKGSVIQYLSYFPDNDKLKKWCNLVECVND